MGYETNTYIRNEILVRDLAIKISARLRAGIQKRGSASIAVSGGNTPKELFRVLSRQNIAWQHVWITLVDERWVDENHKDSNARLVKENLLQNKAAVAQFLTLKAEYPSPFEAAPFVSNCLRKLVMPFDVVLLGMGEDGHTASFFPGADTLMRALNPNDGSLCVGVKPAAAAHERMTLTLPCILNSELLVLYIVGGRKWRVLQDAMGACSVAELPVKAVLEQNSVPLEIYYGTEV